MPLGGQLLGRESGLARVDGGTYLGTLWADGRFTAMNAATGEEAWSEQLPVTGASVATADIDGDGNVDYLVGTKDGRLYALDGRENAPQRILWTLDLGYEIGDVTIANVDADKDAEIVVAAADGYLYVVDDGPNGKTKP